MFKRFTGISQPVSQQAEHGFLDYKTWWRPAAPLVSSSLLVGRQMGALSVST